MLQNREQVYIVILNKVNIFNFTGTATLGTFLSLSNSADFGYFMSIALKIDPFDG